MADLKTLLNSGTHNSCFLIKPAPCAATRSEEIASQERQAEQALIHFSSSPKLHRLPHQAAVEAQTRAWLFNLYKGRLPAARVQRLLDSRFEALGCCLYPYTRSEARSFALNKLVIWTFVLDDVIDDPQILGQDPEGARRFCHRMVKAMFSGLADVEVLGLTSDEDRFSDEDLQVLACSDMDASQAKAQQDLAVEVGVQWVNDMLDMGMSARHLERTRETVVDYMLGIVAYARLRQEKRLPSLDEYIRLRRMEGAGTLNLICCEFSLGIELDDEAWEHPLIKKLDTTTADNLLWMNDLLGFDREYQNADYISLLAVLHYKNHNCASTTADAPTRVATAPVQPQRAEFEDAICEARAMIKAKDQERVRLASEIAAWRPDLQAYFQATQHTITGLTFWTQWSQRYQAESAA